MVKGQQEVGIVGIEQKRNIYDSDDEEDKEKAFEDRENDKTEITEGLFKLRDVLLGSDQQLALKKGNCPSIKHLSLSHLACNR